MKSRPASQDSILINTSLQRGVSAIASTSNVSNGIHIVESPTVGMPESARSARQHKARGVSPGNQGAAITQARGAGESRLVQNRLR